MNLPTLLLTLCFIIFSIDASKLGTIHEEQSASEVSKESNSISTSEIVPSYDNFYDGIDWIFKNSPSIPGAPGGWILGGYSANNRWGRLAWNWPTCPLYPNLASTSGGYLNLQVPGNLQKKGAQIETLRQDYWYGSYRAKLKAGKHSGNNSDPNPQGSVNGFFYYNGPTQQEIDLEILTNEHQSKKVHFVTHPGNYNITYALPFDPTKKFIEYGFDWYENKVDFFVNGVKVGTQKKAVPTMKGKIIINHWTGKSTWGGSPPPSVSNMRVDYVLHVPFILVTYPNLSGIVWEKGKPKTITWNRYGDALSYFVKIELWKDGSFYQTINKAVVNSGSYTWMVPTSLPKSGNYQIKIQSQLSQNYFDFSNNGFAIQ